MARDDVRPEPRRSRPSVPGYTIPQDEMSMLAWTDVSNHIAQARNYWVGTVDADGQPHAVPIWAIWIETTLFFDGARQVRWVRNLAANPQVVVHLESGDKVVILEGSVVRLPHLDPRVLPMVAAASEAKYGGTFRDRGCLALHPQVVFAWTSFPADATRFTWRSNRASSAPAEG